MLGGIENLFCMIADSVSPQLLRECMRAGARDYFLCPLDAGEVLAFLDRMTANRRNENLQVVGSVKNMIDPVLGVEYSTLSKITNKIILVTHSDYRSALTLASIAAELNMSSKYIGRVFLRDTGIKFTAYLTAYRMLEARRLIVNTREKISVIANRVGYVQLNNFYTHFKKHFGVSPCALRNHGSTTEASEPMAYQGEQYEKSV